MEENSNGQQAAGPVLLEQTAEIVHSGQQLFFISSILHCFPGGAEFSPPLQLEFSLAEDEDGETPTTYQVKSEVHVTFETAPPSFPASILLEPPVKPASSLRVRPKYLHPFVPH